MKFQLCVAGGTFDHLHVGHKAFITNALSYTQKLLLGVTSDGFVWEKVAKEEIQPYKTRRSTLEKLIKEKGWQDRIEIAPIHSNSIPKIWEDLPIEAIIASENTLPGAESIRSIRKKYAKPLPIIVLPLLTTSDGKLLSSTRIRTGEISQNIPAGHILYITQDLRQKLSLPFGTLVGDLASWLKNNPIDPEKVATVGDAISDTFNLLGISRKLSVVDLHIARKEAFHSLRDHNFIGNEIVYIVDNPAGTITPALASTLEHVFRANSKDHIIVQIRGEEDLSVLPLILCAPIGFTIFYGQPGNGIVVTHVNQDNKKKAYGFIRKFQAKRVL